jgi:hypothetical protein
MAPIPPNARQRPGEAVALLGEKVPPGEAGALLGEKVLQ